jgi:hypothetical protein
MAKDLPEFTLNQKITAGAITEIPSKRYQLEPDAEIPFQIGRAITHTVVMEITPDGLSSIGGRGSNVEAAITELASNILAELEQLDSVEFERLPDTLATRRAYLEGRLRKVRPSFLLKITGKTSGIEYC